MYLCGMIFKNGISRVANDKCRAGGLMDENGEYYREGRLCVGVKKRLMALIVLLLFTVGKISATPELDVYTLQGKHITITVIFRYYCSIQRLFYKSLLENLDSFAETLKQKGKLERGKIHFEIMTGIWMHRYDGIEMYRHKEGYFCCLNGVVQPIKQDYLAKIISYFASDNWQSFVYDTEKLSPARALQIFNQRIDTINITYQFYKKRILELNSVALYFEDGSLIAKNITKGAGSNRVYGNISNIMPFSAGSLDFVTVGNTIYVVENGLVINQHSWQYYSVTHPFPPCPIIFQPFGKPSHY